MSLPTLTLHQPYASLIAEGVKTIETRSWRCPEKLIGQYVGIHAAAQAPTKVEYNTALPVGDWLPYEDNYYDWWIQHYAAGVPSAPGDVPLPLGAIVATARVTECLPMKHATEPRNGDCLVVSPAGLLLHPDVRHLQAGQDVSDQLPYGDFAPGRWAWMLDDVKPTTERCPGCLGDGVRWRSDDGGSMLNCRACHGTGQCAPVPAKGKQRVWYWTPEAGR